MMNDGVATRVEKDMEAIRVEMDNTAEKLRSELRSEMRALLQNLGSEMTLMLEQTMGKLASQSQSMVVKQKGVVGTDTAPTIPETRALTKYPKMKCPRFDGTDYRIWLLKIQLFFELDQTKEEDRVAIAMMHLDGKALQWHQVFMMSQGSLREVKWNHYITEMRIRFDVTDPMYELVSLKQLGTVDEYYDEFESLLSLLLDLPEAYALGIFIANLKPEISKPIRLFMPKTLTQALRLARQLESVNTRGIPFLPLWNPQSTNQTSTSVEEEKNTG